MNIQHMNVYCKLGYDTPRRTDSALQKLKMGLRIHYHGSCNSIKFYSQTGSQYHPASNRI